MDFKGLSDQQGVELKLANVLKQLLDKRQLTLKELAAKTNISPSTLSGWKNGVSPRDLSEVLRCAKYFGVSLEKLLFDEPTDATALEGLLTESLFDGYARIRIERVLTKKKG